MIYKGCLSTEYVNFGAESIEDTLSSEDYMKMALDRVSLKERVAPLIGWLNCTVLALTGCV